MRYGLIFTPRGLRPFASASVRPGRLQKLTPGQSAAFALLFLMAVVLSTVIVLKVF